jgi:hypothetical protein
MVPLLVTDTDMVPPGPSLYLVPFHHEGTWYALFEENSYQVCGPSHLRGSLSLIGWSVSSSQPCLSLMSVVCDSRAHRPEAEKQ